MLVSICVLRVKFVFDGFICFNCPIYLFILLNYCIYLFIHCLLDMSNIHIIHRNESNENKRIIKKIQINILRTSNSNFLICS